MKQYLKEQVREALIRYMSGFATQRAAARSLQGVSAIMVSQVKNKHWNHISDTQWQNIAKQVGFYAGNEWQQADTSAYLLLRIIFNDAQYNAMAYGVAMATGIGKTFTAQRYARENDYTHYIACTVEMNRKTFMVALAESMGLEKGNSVEETMALIIAKLKENDDLLLVLDDAHKLKDRVLQFAATLYRHLAGRCGIVMLGNDELRMRIVEGVRLNKEGYEEIYKNIGRRFITLGRLSDKDVALVCRANGLKDEGSISCITDACGSNLLAATEMIQELSGKKNSNKIINEQSKTALL